VDEDENEKKDKKDKKRCVRNPRHLPFLRNSTRVRGGVITNSKVEGDFLSGNRLWGCDVCQKKLK
jgi:hypothetical protein